MNKLFAILITAIFAGQSTYAQSNWVDYKIDNKLSCKLPAKPAPDGDQSVMAKTADSVVCIITAIDFKKAANIDSATLAALALQNTFAQGMKNGIAKKMPGFTLGDIKTSKWNNYYCYSMEGVNTGKSFKVYTLMVLIGTHIYSLSTLLPQYKDPGPKDEFFASLRLNHP